MPSPQAISRPRIDSITTPARSWSVCIRLPAVSTKAPMPYCGADHLGRDQQEQRHRGGDAEARQDARHRAGQHDLGDDVGGRQAEALAPCGSGCAAPNRRRCRRRSPSGRRRRARWWRPWRARRCRTTGSAAAAARSWGSGTAPTRSAGRRRARPRRCPWRGRPPSPRAVPMIQPGTMRLSEAPTCWPERAVDPQRVQRVDRRRRARHEQRRQQAARSTPPARARSAREHDPAAAAGAASARSRRRGRGRGGDRRAQTCWISRSAVAASSRISAHSRRCMSPAGRHGRAGRARPPARRSR